MARPFFVKLGGSRGSWCGAEATKVEPNSQSMARGEGWELETDRGLGHEQ